MAAGTRDGAAVVTDIFGQLAAEWHHDEHAVAEKLRHLMHPHPHNVPQPAAAPTIPTDTPEVTPMSLLAEIETGLKDAVSKFEAVDKEALDKVEAIKANPELAPLLDVLAALAKSELPPGILTAASSGFQMLTKLAEIPAAGVPAEQPQYVAGPQVGGQA